VKVCVLVNSCNNYSDLWIPFFTLYFKYFGEYIPVYLSSETNRYKDNRVTTILNECDPLPNSWNKALDYTLQKLLEEDYTHLIYFQEDYLLQKPVSQDTMARVIVLAEKYNMDCFRLFPCPPPEGTVINEGISFAQINRQQDYLVSLQSAIWDIQTLKKLVKIASKVGGGKAWQFEIFGTSYLRDTPEAPFNAYSVLKDGNPPLDYFCTAVVSGKWLPDAVNLCIKEGIKVDLKRRKVK
jgi:hypothetical protein